MSKLCTVVFTGKLQPNVDPEQAAAKFASVFKVPEDKARKLIRDAREKALKKDIDPTAAAHYRDVLNDIGLVARIDSADGTILDKATDSRTQACPKCGAARIEQGVCKNCGVLVEAYRANQSAERKTQTLPHRNPTPPAQVTETAGATNTGGSPQTPPQPESVPIGHGLSWISGGWSLFKQAPLVWIGALVVLILINLALAFVPIVGGLASVLIGPVLMAGLMAGAHEQDTGGEFRLNHLFDGFSNQTASLLGVGALYLLGSIVLGVLMVLIMLGPIMSVAGGMDAQAIEAHPEVLLGALGPSMMLAFLLALALIVPLIMAYWFAPALVILNGIGAVAAMKLSFIGCLKNMLPFLIYGLVCALLMLAALIPFGLGLLILSPVLVASMYVAYKDIFYGNT